MQHHKAAHTKLFINDKSYKHFLDTVILNQMGDESDGLGICSRQA